MSKNDGGPAFPFLTPVEAMCATCAYFRYSGEGHCYMFRHAPFKPSCGQYKWADALIAEGKKDG